MLSTLPGHALLEKIPTSVRPGSIAIDGVAGRIYVASPGDSAPELGIEIRHSTPPYQSIAVLSAGLWGSMALDRKAGKLYVGSNQSELFFGSIPSVHVFDAGDLHDVGSIGPLTTDPFGLAIDPLIHVLYVAVGQSSPEGSGPYGTDVRSYALDAGPSYLGDTPMYGVGSIAIAPFASNTSATKGFVAPRPRR